MHQGKVPRENSRKVAMDNQEVNSYQKLNQTHLDLGLPSLQTHEESACCLSCFSVGLVAAPLPSDILTAICLFP